MNSGINYCLGMVELVESKLFKEKKLKFNKHYINNGPNII